jgi:hypothetical protein
MKTAILSLIVAAGVSSVASATAIQCRVMYPPGTPVPKSHNFCIKDGESNHVRFKKEIDIDSIRVLKTDGALECSELESDVGLFMFDKVNSSLVVGPKLSTGCYLILWNEA